MTDSPLYAVNKPDVKIPFIGAVQTLTDSYQVLEHKCEALVGVDDVM